MDEQRIHDQKIGCTPQAPKWIKKWWVAMRPFALPASTMPVIFGTVLAITIGKAQLKFYLFVASLLGMAALHTGANLLNDVYDYKKGVDKHVNPVSGGVVRGWVTTREALIAGWLFLTIGLFIGFIIVHQVGFPILWIGLLGIFIGVFYTWGPMPLKFNAVGDLAVFLNFGILGALGAWTVQMGHPSWVPVLWAIPMSLLVVGILHANNWRDIKNDTQGGIYTLASIFGDIRSESYFAFLLFSPFAVILFFIFLSFATNLNPKMPLTFLVTFMAMPMAIKLVKKSKQRNNSKYLKDFLALDGATAQLNLMFGILCISALGLDVLINFFR